MSEVFAPSATRAESLPAWMWPHLCDLDAPFVAMLWQSLFYRSLHAPVVAVTAVVLGLSVWLVYALDHLLDVSLVLAQKTSRHKFHSRHKQIFMGLAAMVILAVFALVRQLPTRLSHWGMLLAGILVLYLVAVHSGAAWVRRRVPKESIVGILFAAGTCLAPGVGASHPKFILLPGLLFAVLCTTNCLAIERWESGTNSENAAASLTYRMAQHLSGIWWGLVCGSLLLALLYPWLHMVLIAISISALGFLCLDIHKDRFTADVLRVLADAPLLSPLLCFTLR